MLAEIGICLLRVEYDNCSACKNTPEICAMRVLLVALKAGSGSDRYYEILRDSLSRYTEIKVELLFLPHWLELFPAAFPWYLKKIDFSSWDIVHTNLEHSHYFVGSGRVTVATALHNVFEKQYRPYTSLAQKIYHRFWIKPHLVKSLYSGCTILSISRYTKKSLLQCFDVSDGDIDVIFNGIDTDTFRPDAAEKESRARTRLLFVGNTTARKGFDLLPEIMRRLGHEYELFFTSGLRDTQVLQKKYDLPANMHPLHRLSLGELVCEYNKCDMLLFPSRLEGFGYCIAEALSCGKPVVTTNVTAMPELVCDGENGYLCEVDDVDGFVKAVQKCRELPVQGIVADAKALFSLSQYAQKMEQYYRSVLA